MGYGVFVKMSPGERKEKNNAEVRDLIARADYGMDVYRHFLTPYIGSQPLKLGYSYKSPLRTEKDPSFNLFRSTNDGTIWFMDQARGGGNCITYIMRLFKCDFRDAIRKLRSEVLGLPADPTALERLENFTLGPMPPPIPPAPEFPKLITPQWRSDDFYCGSWAPQDEKYYPSHIFGPEVLAAYHCRPLNSYRYQQDAVNSTDRRDFIVGADWYINQSMYCYSFGERHKIVRPYTQPHPKTGKKRKWISNTRRELDLFGAHLLPEIGQPKAEACCLLAGNRDTMAFYKLTGVPAVASTAEGHLPTDEQLEFIRARSERQFVLYDNDTTGQMFEAILSDDWENPLYLKWLDNHREKAGYHYWFNRGLSQILHQYGENDLTKLLIDTPVSHHQLIGTWLRQAMGLF